MTNHHEGSFLFNLSSPSPTPSTVPLNPSTSMTIISAEFSLKKEWDNKLKLIHLVTNSRDTSSRSPVAMIRTVLPWNKVSSLAPDSNFFSLLALKATELKEPEKERESPSEDALSALKSKACQSPSSRRANNKSRVSPIPLFPEDWVPREPTTSENSMELRDKRRTNQSPLLWSRRTSPEEPSRARRTPLLLKDKKPPRSKDWSLTWDLEERESTRKTRSEDGRRPSKPELLITSWSMSKSPRKRPLTPKLRSRERIQSRLPRPSQSRLRDKSSHPLRLNPSLPKLN